MHPHVLCAAKWVDPVHQPEWFSRVQGPTPLGISANGAHGSAAGGPASTDAFGVGRAAAVADWRAPETGQEPAAAFQYDASDFMGDAPQGGHSSTGAAPGLHPPSGWAGQSAVEQLVGGAQDSVSLQPATPPMAEAGHHLHLVQRGLTDASPGFAEDQDCDAEDFKDLLAMLTVA